MRRVSIIYSLLLAALLSACGRSDPVDENAVAPAEELAGDMAAEGLATPANAAAAEAVRQAAVPPATGGLDWTYEPQDNSARFGPPATPALSIQCQRPREGTPQLIFVRHLPPSHKGQATISFTGNGKAASLPIAAVAGPDGMNGEWRTMVAPDDHARAVSEVFAGPATVEVSVSGTPPLIVSTAGAPRRVLNDCLRP